MSLSCALLDVTFCCDDNNTLFVKDICIVGIKEPCKKFVKEFKYKFPTKEFINDNFENYSFGTVYNDKINKELCQILEKFDVIITNKKIKKEFLANYIKEATKVYDLSQFD